MKTTPQPRIAFLFEHPSWSENLIKKFSSNQIDLTLINVADLTLMPDQGRPEFDLAVNRINIMPSASRNPSVVFHTLHYLTWLASQGVPILNGSQAHFTGASKAVQNGIFAGLGLHCPKAAAVYRISDIPAASNSIGFPLIIKPNIGGSGSGIVKVDSPGELADKLASNSIDLGIDGTGLVQEFIPSDGYVYRIEILGDRLFYSIKQKFRENTFNYCAADGCSVAQKPEKPETDFQFCALNQESRIQPFNPDKKIVGQAISIIQKAGADLGGVEYLLDQNTGTPCFYDFNPYSNFVPNGKELFGFSPEQKFVEFVKHRAKDIIF